MTEYTTLEARLAKAEKARDEYAFSATLYKQEAEKTASRLAEAEGALALRRYQLEEERQHGHNHVAATFKEKVDKWKTRAEAAEARAEAVITELKKRNEYIEALEHDLKYFKEAKEKSEAQNKRLHEALSAIVQWEADMPEGFTSLIPDELVKRAQAALRPEQPAEKEVKE